MDRRPNLLARFRNRTAKRDPRRRALWWITLLCVLFGLADAGTPIEAPWRTLRDTVRQHAASGRIVVVGIDEPTVEGLQEWPLRRRHYAALIDRLNALGARRIFLDMSFTTRSTRQEDRLLVDAIARSRAQVVLPAWFQIDPITHRRTDVLPAANLRPHSRIANISVHFDRTGVVRRLPFAMQVAGNRYTGFAAEMAGVAAEDDRTFPLDYSIRVGSIPVVSAITILRGRAAPFAIAGHDVLVGITSAQLDHAYVAPTVGLIPGVFLHALGAETLIAGPPVELPWYVPFPIAWILMVAALFLRTRRFAVPCYAAALAGAIGLPFLLDARMAFVDIIPTILLVVSTGSWLLWSRYRRSWRERGIVNAVSGLPNLKALREVGSEPDMALVAARVRNFPEIAASLPADHEQALVAQIARRLAFGSNDATIYHGDEGIFAWLIPHGSVASISDQFDALQALFRNAVAVGDRHVDLAISFGVAAETGLSPFNRLGGALMAADAAGVAGLHWMLHEPVEASDSRWKLSLLTRLDAAIDAGEIGVAYQPKIDLRSGRVIGAEALVRWTHPEKGPISPVDFIPVAEQQNRIGKLTYHVLETAIRAAAIVNGHGMTFGIAVNLSVRLLDDPDLVANVMALLRRYALDPRRLTLEITETAALSGHARSVAVLDALRGCGIGLSIDDYGTGFSNLDNLRTIPANEIKIDRSFVDAITQSHSDAVMVRSTIAMAHSLGQTVVAEGVERAETLDALRSMGCDQVQGYLTGRPMKFTALSRLLLRDRRKAAA